MKSFGKLTMAALMLAGSAIGATIVTSTPAAAQVSIGIGVGGPGYYHRGYDGRCADRRFRYYHGARCHRGYAPVAYGPAYNGYYDTGYYGPGYYEPAVTGFWFTDSGGHRRHHDGRFNGGGYHGHSGYHH